MKRAIGKAAVAAALALAATSALAADRPDPAAARLAALTAAELKGKLPPAASTVLVQPWGDKGRADPFAPALERALRGAGFAVASDRASAPGAQPIRYSVTPALGGYVVQLIVDGEASTRLYRPNEVGALVSAGPATVRSQ